MFVDLWIWRGCVLLLCVQAEVLEELGRERLPMVKDINFLISCEDKVY